jgi:ATPase subunit of ABC transporter with duplicated ATPase domains
MDALVTVLRAHPGATILSTHDRALLDQLGARIVEL